MIHRLLRGPQVSRLLTRFGIDPTRYWLLMDLFGTLSERREMLGQLGRQGVTLKVLAAIYGGIAGLISLAFLATRSHVTTYLLSFVSMTAFVLMSVLVSETSNSLINPVEALILAHQPINGATYTSAKLTHLLSILLYFVPGINLIPAILGLGLGESRWFYPLEHMLAAIATGLLLALVCCGVFGWLIRFVPATRLKAAGRIAEFLPTLAFLSFRVNPQFLRRLQIVSWLSSHWRWEAGFAAVLCGIAVLGIRSLSVDYLVRVSSIVHGRPTSRKPLAGTPRSRMGEAVGIVFGGQASRAGFEYARRMMTRDWQFRRQLTQLLPTFVIMASSLPAGLRTSVFSRQFSPMHMAPHVFGFLLFSVCMILVYGSDYKGVWMFLLVPGGAFGRFGRGIYSSLWIFFIVVPHLLLLVLLAWKWNLPDAGLFVSYSAAVASLYLGLELRLIDGIPFAKQPKAARSAFALPLMLGFLMVAGMAVALQYFLLFRSRTVVGIAAAVLACAAYFATRGSLASLEIAMRHSLSDASSESKLLYHEVAA